MTEIAKPDSIKASIISAAGTIASAYGLSDADGLAQIMLRHHIDAGRIGDEVIADSDKTHCAMALYSVINKAANELLNLDVYQHLTHRIVQADDQAKSFRVLNGIFELATTRVRELPLSTNNLVVADLVQDLCEYWLDASGEEMLHLVGIVEDDVTQDSAYKVGNQIFPFIRRVVASCGWFVEGKWLATQMQIQSRRLWVSKNSTINDEPF